MVPNFKELRASNDAENDGVELQKRMDEDGYLFFRQLQDPDKLRQLRREMLTVMQQGGWLIPGTDPSEGIVNLNARCTEGDLEYTEVYHKVYKLQSFHQSGHWPEVMHLLRQIMDCEVMPQPQKVARLWFPKYTDHTTPVHQDFVHFQGTFRNLTCWAPVGDCPRELGGLAVLRGSHKVRRVLEHHFSLGAGSLHLNSDEHAELGGDWRSTDYEIGDTLIFPALTVHQALPNLTEDRLRVSLDNRYQRVGDPIAEHMLTPHLSNFSPISWEDVYRGWSSDEGKYYWQELDNPVVPRDASYSNHGFDEAMELARAGDRKAKHHLERISRRDPDSEQGRRASAVLADLP